MISLGGAERLPLAARLARPNVRVAGYVDQLRLLRDATLFVTHQGLNSTHEAVLRQVPMLSYPFFGDQPRLAARCRELGLALPLADTPRAPLTPETVRAAFARIEARRPALTGRLAAARDWELAVIARRPAVIARIRALMA